MKRIVALILSLAMLLSMASSALAYMDPTGQVIDPPGQRPDSHEHRWRLEAVDYTTCTGPAYYVYVCDTCGYQRVEERPGPGHDYQKQSSIPATCTEGGYDVYVCSRCGDSKQEPTPALGHNFGSWEQSSPPSCFTEGTEQRRCSRCGLMEYRSTPAIGKHDWGEWKVETPGNCVTIELRRHKCKRCGETAYQNWGYGDHDWDHGWTEEITPPNCTYPGLGVLHCAIEPTHTQQYEIPIDPDAHDWGEWEVVEPATPEGPGIERRVCKINPDHVEERDLLYTGPTVAPFVPNPVLVVTGDQPEGPFSEGDTFNVELQVRNEGNVDLNLNHYTASDRDSSGDPLSALPLMLAPGEVWVTTVTVTVTPQDVADGLTDPVTGEPYMVRQWDVYYDYYGGSDSALATVGTIMQVSDSHVIQPKLTTEPPVPNNLYAGLRMTVSEPDPSKPWYVVSDVVTFDITLHNVGSVPLDNCQAIIFDGDGTTYTVDFGALAAGEMKTMPWSVTINTTHLANERDLINFEGQGWVPQEILEGDIPVTGCEEGGLVLAAPDERDLPVKDAPPPEDEYALYLQVTNLNPQAAYYEGDPIVFFADVTNKSTDTLYDVVVYMAFGSGGDISEYVGTLAPGETKNVTLSDSVLSIDVSYAETHGGMLDLHFTAQGLTADEQVVDSNECEENLPIAEKPPVPDEPNTQITITGVANGSGAGKTVGDWVEATVTVENTGNTPWIVWTIWIDGTGSADYDFSDFETYHGKSYKPGESFSFVLGIKVRPEDAAPEVMAVIRDITVTALNEYGYFDSNTEQCNIPLDGTIPPPVTVEDEPELVLTVSCLDSEPFWFDGAGQTGDIHYQAIITNVGDAPCTLDTLSMQTSASFISCPLGSVVLYPAESTPVIYLSYNFSESEKAGDGKLHITFQAHGFTDKNSYDSNAVELVHELVEFPPFVPDPVEVIVEKYEVSYWPTVNGYRENDVVDYEVWVYNNSDTLIPLITVNDPLCGGTVGTIANLAPYSWDYVSFSYTVTHDDVVNKLITNVATADFTDPISGLEVSKPSNPVVVPTTEDKDLDALYGVSIKITLGKEPANGSYYVEGEHIPITVDWKNTSDQTLYKVEVWDEMADWMGAAPGGYLVKDGTLAPGETGTFTYDYLVDDIDTELYKYVGDWAYIQGCDKDDNYYWAEDYVTKPADVDPPTPPTVLVPGVGLKVEKIETSTPAVNPAYYTEGETITYSIIITNIGDVDLFNVTVADSLSETFMGAFATITVLHPGESRAYPFTHKVTADDVTNTKVVNYGIGYYSWGELVDVPVVSDPVISPTGPQPGPVPPGTPGHDPDPHTPTGHVDTPIVKEGKDDCCVLTLKAKGAGAAEYEQHLCSKHLAVYEAAQRQAAAFGSDENAKANVWRNAASQWKAALDEMYQDILKASTGSARMAVMAERAAFYAYVESFRAVMLKQNTRQPSKAEQAAAEMLMRQCAELCYVIHYAPEDRPDSVVFGSYRSMAAANGTKCIVSEQPAVDGNITYREALCADHAKLDQGMLAMVGKAQTRAMMADAFNKARRSWQGELNRLAAEQYKLLDKEDKQLVVACRNLFDKLLEQRQALYEFIYAGHPEIVNEIMTRTVMLDVIRRCK